VSAARVKGAAGRSRGLRVAVFGPGQAGAVPAAAAQPDAQKSLREDGTWAAGGGSGDVTGPSSSVDSEVAIFSGPSGKIIKRAAATGIAKLASGVLSAVTTWAGAGLTGTADGVPHFSSAGSATDLAPPGGNRSAYVLGWTAGGALAWVALSTGMVVCSETGVPTGDNSSDLVRTT